jgi:hypothetical protein
MLRAARHLQRYPATDTRRGRPGRWPRELLLTVTARLTDILERETSARLSFASFVDHYLRLLDFPAEIIEALAAGDLNLFEAEQLARLDAKRLRTTSAQAQRTRTELLATHLQTRASGERLRRRVNELLSAPQAASVGDSVSIESATHDPGDLSDFDPYDSTHLFWEQIKQLGYAFREIRPADVTDREVEELLKASEPLLAVLSRILRRKDKQDRKAHAKLSI